MKFPKYEYYSRAVQSPESDVLFFQKTYRSLKGRSPKIFREDFCGTFAVSKAWVELGPNHIAEGVDLDPEPLEYGREQHLPKLTKTQQRRLRITQTSVLSTKLPQADIIAALNFSYFIFKDRKTLKKYFTLARKKLRPGGIFVVDLFGGSQCFGAIEDRIRHRNFTYYWDQKGYDPISGFAKFEIHFRVRGQKHERVFHYDWRMWTIPEVRDIMREVGFRKTHVYWEGTRRDGSGDGIFTKTEKGESCESWIAYVVGEK